MKKWNMEDAKTYFSELVHDARTIGPQSITALGGESFVLISKSEFEKLKPPKVSLPEFIRQSPLYDSGLDLKRENEPERGTPQS